MSDPTVLDISHYQSEPDWQTLIGAGIIGVILKATEGTTYVDDTYHRRSIDAADSGLLVSSYHFLKHGDVDRQMKHYLMTVEPEYGERVCIDYEDPACTLDDLEAAVEWIVGEIPTLQVTVYGSAKLTADARSAKAGTILEETSLWIARYSSSQPDIASNVWKTWTLWQYTDSGRVAGWGPVDCNRFNGSDENLVKWFGPAVAPAPPPEPVPPYTVTIPADVTEVRLIIEK
jgi:GH25 family lysozyme M1 (1,4-beta-N-acetylmuramidase)